MVSNDLLAQAIQRAGWSNKGLALRIQTRADRLGIKISCTHINVGRWLKGGGIRPRTAAVVAEVFSEAFGELVTPEALGFVSESGVLLPLSFSEDLPETLRGLASTAEHDIADSVELQKAAATSVAWTAPLMAWLLGRPEPLQTSPTGRRVGMPEVAAICSTIKLFMQLDFQFGGGHARSALAQYFRHDVLPLLDGTYSEAVGRKLFSAAAEAAQLLGWTAYDLGRHGLAQRYFVQGLRLAQAGDDRVMGGRLLSNMSHQANYLGFFSEAAQLARAAQEGARGAATPTVTAMFLAMEARARAGAGDGRNCAIALREAEQLFDKRVLCEDPPWIEYFDDAELAGEAAHCFRDLRNPGLAVEFVSRAIELTDPGYVRTHAFIRLVHAVSCLHGDAADIEQAAEIAIKAIELAGPLKSERYLRYIRDLYVDFMPHRRNADVTRALAVFDGALSAVPS
ncbi:hypothetical protein [Couchioplanes caeruleus]|uniref:hypothetical protein n=1 Tax=Couchioplanes caeruleus TaxID=56438 RepID=UPI0008FF51DB|nr:hypothetical protein [Couchioplanes caeruleus]